MILRELGQALSVRHTFYFLFTGIFFGSKPAVMSDRALCVVEATFIRCPEFHTSRNEGPLFFRKTELLSVTIGMRVALITIRNSLTDFSRIVLHVTFVVSLVVAILRNTLPARSA